MQYILIHCTPCIMNNVHMNNVTYMLSNIVLLFVFVCIFKYICISFFKDNLAKNRDGRKCVIWPHTHTPPFNCLFLNNIPPFVVVVGQCIYNGQNQSNFIFVPSQNSFKCKTCFGGPRRLLYGFFISYFWWDGVLSLLSSLRRSFHFQAGICLILEGGRNPGWFVFL